MNFPAPKFKGFSKLTFNFLITLKENNTKSWFVEHRDKFEKDVLLPLQNLVMDLSGFMLGIDPAFETTPVLSKTISRIHRDTRFTKDKSPYRANMWVVFKRRTQDWKIHPGYFFEIFPDWYRFGMGFYSATHVTMDRIRAYIDEKPANFMKEISLLEKQNLFVAEGEMYKKILKPDLPPSLQNWYQRKNIYLVCNRKIDDLIFSTELVDELMAGFGVLAPLYQFLWKMSEE